MAHKRGRKNRYSHHNGSSLTSVSGRQAFKRHIKRLSKAFNDDIYKEIRRYVCVVCCAFFPTEEVVMSTCFFAFDTILNSANYRHIKDLDIVYPNMEPRSIFRKELPNMRGIFVCEKYCWTHFNDLLSQEREVHQVPVFPTLLPLVPLQSIPPAVRELHDLELATMSLLDFSVSLGGGLSRGYYKNLTGDMRMDEDLAGTAGTVVGQFELSSERRSKVEAAMRSVLSSENHLTSKYFMVGERTKHGIGFPFISSDKVTGRGTEERGETVPEGANGICGHIIPRKEVVRRRQMRERCSQSLRAGVVYGREDGLPHTVYWSDEVEPMAFPFLFPRGYGGFEWSFQNGVPWDEYVMKRLWSVNPMFRSNSLYIVFLFDVGEKREMHRAPNITFIPKDLENTEASEVTLMSESNAGGFESVCKKDLSRARRGLATASLHVGKPNVFQTETMNERDMMELEVVSFRIYHDAPLAVDDVSLAILYKRQEVLMERLLPLTGMKGLRYGSIRLEIQSGRSYRLHAHNMILVEAVAEKLYECISASLGSLSSSRKEVYEPMSKHICISSKCGVAACVYGYPVLEGAEKTQRVHDDEQNSVGHILYKREIGTHYVPCSPHDKKDCHHHVCIYRFGERDERITPFCIKLTHVRCCHGAFLVCDDELATGYAGKYVFKRSGGIGLNTGNVSLYDIYRSEEVQLLQLDREPRITGLLKENIAVRTVSMMEMCLHLNDESVVYNTFHNRELWIILPFEKKKFVDGSTVREGIMGSGQLRDYYSRLSQYENDTIQLYYCKGCVRHHSDAANGIRCSGTNEDGVEFVWKGRKRKKLLARIMPVRGTGRRLIELSCWILILLKVPHRSTADVWNFQSGEESWDAAARNGALGEENKAARGIEAISLALNATVERELWFCTKIGMTEVEKDRVRTMFVDAVDNLVRTLSCGTDDIRIVNDESEGIGRTRFIPVRNAGETFDELGDDAVLNETRLTAPSSDPLELKLWKNRFRKNGWVLKEGEIPPNESVVIDLPVHLKEELRVLSKYPSQLRACIEILDSIVRTHGSLKRFVTGAAGRGKSFLKKVIIRILRSAGLEVKVLAVAAIVAQDDEGGQGSTIASAFNTRFSSDSQFDKLALSHAKVDIFFFDELSFASTANARAIVQYLSRGEYMRREGVLLDPERRKRRRVLPYSRHEDPYCGAKIVVLGDLMQLNGATGDRLYFSQRLWGDVFRGKTHSLVECVRSTDQRLIELSDAIREVRDDMDSGNTVRRVWEIVRSRSVVNMSEVPLGTTVLSPRFERAQRFCAAGLQEIQKRESECDEQGWSRDVFCINCDEYVVNNKTINLEDCIGMEDATRCENKRKVLDKDHTRIRTFSFRIGMVAVVTENGVKQSGKATSSDFASWPHENNSSAEGISAPDTVSWKRSRAQNDNNVRFLNGERVKISGAVRRAGVCVAVRVVSVSRRWNGERVIRKTATKGEGINKPSLREARTVRFMKNGVERTGIVTRRQVPLVLELGLTVHKAQGMTLKRALVDMGCSSGAYTGGLIYTAVTRVRRLSDLWFIDVPENEFEMMGKIKSCAQAGREMRLYEQQSRGLRETAKDLEQELKRNFLL